MKKLIVVVPSYGVLEDKFLHSSLFSEFSVNHFVYEGTLSAYDEVSSLIAEYHFKEFSFLETEVFYRLRVWEE